MTSGTAARRGGGGGGESRPPLAARVHVDSLSPDSVSVVAAKGGDAEATVDRKVEADVRLLASCPDPSALDLDILLGDDDEDIVGHLA